MIRLDPARSQLIGGFIQTYLQLNAEEMKKYDREFEKLAPAEKEANMELMNPWVQQGWEEGKHEGKEELVAYLISPRFGSVSSEIAERLNHLSSEQLNELGEALFEFKTSADLENWLSHSKTQ